MAKIRTTFGKLRVDDVIYLDRDESKWKITKVKTYRDKVYGDKVVFDAKLIFSKTAKATHLIEDFDAAVDSWVDKES